MKKWLTTRKGLIAYTAVCVLVLVVAREGDVVGDWWVAFGLISAYLCGMWTGRMEWDD